MGARTRAFIYHPNVLPGGWLLFHQKYFSSKIFFIKKYYKNMLAGGSLHVNQKYFSSLFHILLFIMTILWFRSTTQLIWLTFATFSYLECLKLRDIWFVRVLLFLRNSFYFNQGGVLTFCCEELSIKTYIISTSHQMRYFSPTWL